MSNTSNTSNTSKTQSSRKSREPDEPDEVQEPEEAQEPADDRPSPMQVLRHARTQLAELTGMAPESVSSFEQTEGGWTLEVEVLEIARVPDTMSLLASYRVELDPRGELTGYRRVRRYERGRADPHRR
ncbi:gas vesicle protein GvpO [Streptomyces stelliscabiei]|uniref:gas vesicle protein GvpO n=1 Tax=Streptomyces stelliscabiei TaxID=146820 RepID=UPI0029B151EC|nr:gas vesicle protein [Streptomyces stelliscabiei]MDX2554791.1 gas vesicle protein [Streptomyces stelliscabiei]MDX2610834.1 gas vesicle protein [Streptomyces stelliscabiei]MDX2639097.1 gas vesicle protein [Streptomyces stelliscabiei]MDX2662070.1 gas vesicle protein [Streptomyces stelliscabiei]MDX2712545.1 gas vesicle protein [Streptomyces stelliscabiei]